MSLFRLWHDVKRNLTENPCSSLISIGTTTRVSLQRKAYFVVVVVKVWFRYANIFRHKGKQPQGNPTQSIFSQKTEKELSHVCQACSAAQLDIVVSILAFVDVNGYKYFHLSEENCHRRAQDKFVSVCVFIFIAYLRHSSSPTLWSNCRKSDIWRLRNILSLQIQFKSTKCSLNYAALPEVHCQISYNPWNSKTYFWNKKQNYF